MSDYTYRPQEVDYLGFLEAQLRDLQGIDRLAYELIQNADDVQAAEDAAPPTRLSFDVTDEALVVQNDSVFRPVDFQRLQSIAGGGKREEPETTGAFGLGFIAVYQVTDAPEIFSNDLHWVIRPEAPPERRIREQPAETEGTRFFLPWAFDAASPVRRALRMEAVAPQQLDDIARQLSAAIELAALFLKQLRVLEVCRNGELLRRVARDETGTQHVVLRREDGEARTWLLFQGDFAEDAARLRQRYGRQIEEKRHSEVTLAVADTDLPAQGRLFAVLPTDAAMPLPVHVNADFFPTNDRRRVHFDGDYQSRWNEQAVACAAHVLAANLQNLRDALQPAGLWRLLQGALETEQAAARGELPAVFGVFWQTLASRLQEVAVVYTNRGQWVKAPTARIVQDAQAFGLLNALDVAAVHPELSPYLTLMRRADVGVQDLSLADLRRALQALDIDAGTPLALAPAFLRTLEDWRRLWRLFDRLLGELPRPNQRQIVKDDLSHLPLALDDMMTLAPLRRVYRGDDEAKALFPDVAWLHEALDREAFPARFVPRFGARQAVARLQDMGQEQLEHAWRMGRLDIPRLFRWFEGRQIEIFADDPALQQEITKLPLAPIAGELRPLQHLYIPGGFEDPLQLAGVVDLESVGGRRQFLEDLGLQQLDFDSYLHSSLPRVLGSEPDLPSDARQRLLTLLAQRLGQIRDDEEVRETLSRLPLIPCMDGEFRPAPEVYVSREAAALVGLRAHIAEPPESEARAALYRWLGVRREPTAADLVQTIYDISGEQIASRAPLAPAALDRVLQCWQRLQGYYERDRLPDELLEKLRAGRTLPNRARVMSEPRRLLFLDDEDLAARFHSQQDDGATLDRYLLLEEEALPSLMATTGVRHFSAAVEVQIAAQERATDATTIAQRFQDRLPLVARLLQAEEGHAQNGDDPLGPLRDLRILQIPDLQLRYRLQLGPESIKTAPERQAAAFVAREETLYIEASEQPTPWPAIARELAQALVTSGAGRGAAGLALGIREVLGAATYDEAAATLDELGYP